MIGFITGLPRTRSAWFTFYLRGLGIEAIHEPMNKVNDAEEFHELFRSRPLVFCDTGLPITDFQQVWPDKPTVIIERPKRYAYESFARWADKIGQEIDLGIAWEMFGFFEAQLSTVQGYRVPFTEVDIHLEFINRHLQIPYDPEWAEFANTCTVELNQLNVNADSYAAWMDGALS